MKGCSAEVDKVVASILDGEINSSIKIFQGYGWWEETGNLLKSVIE